MIRVILDELGNGHDDLILKIDAMPAFTQTADLYYMADFLKLDPDKIDKVPDDLGIEYIKYIKDKFVKINNIGTFIIFDISDQYIGGLLMSKGKKGLIKTTYVSTDKIHGYEIDKENIDRLIAEKQLIFEKENEWILSEVAIIEGLNWSIERINKNKS